MAHHVGDEHGHLVFRERAQVEKITADRPARAIEIAHAQPHLLRGSAGREDLKAGGQKSAMQLGRDVQVILHPGVRDVQLGRVRLQLPLRELLRGHVEHRQHHADGFAVGVQIRHAGNLAEKGRAVCPLQFQLARPGRAGGGGGDDLLGHLRLAEKFPQVMTLHLLRRGEREKGEECGVPVFDLPGNADDNNAAAGVLQRGMAGAQPVLLFLPQRHVANEKAEVILGAEPEPVDGDFREEEGAVGPQAIRLHEDEAIGLQCLENGRQQRIVGAADQREDRVVHQLARLGDEELIGADIHPDDLALQIGDDGRVVDILEELLEIDSFARRNRARLGNRDDRPGAPAGFHARFAALHLLQLLGREVDAHRGAERILQCDRLFRLGVHERGREGEQVNPPGKAPRTQTESVARVVKLVSSGATRAWAGAVSRRPDPTEKRKCETVRSKEMGAPVNRIAGRSQVLTPWDKDLDPVHGPELTAHGINHRRTCG